MTAGGADDLAYGAAVALAAATALLGLALVLVPVLIVRPTWPSAAARRAVAG